MLGQIKTNSILMRVAYVSENTSISIHHSYLNYCSFFIKWIETVYSIHVSLSISVKYIIDEKLLYIGDSSIALYHSERWNIYISHSTFCLSWYQSSQTPRSIQPGVSLLQYNISFMCVVLVFISVCVFTVSHIYAGYLNKMKTN